MSISNPFDGAVVALWAERPDELAEVENFLSRMGCRTRSVASGEQLREMIESATADLVIVSLPRFFQRPLDLMFRRRHAGSDPPVLVAAGTANAGLYLEAIQRGAYDGVGLPVDENELVHIAGRALQASRTRSFMCWN